MPIITDAENDNMKVQAELIVNRLIDEYKVRARGDRLQEGVINGNQRQIQGGLRAVGSNKARSESLKQYADVRSASKRG